MPLTAQQPLSGSFTTDPNHSTFQAGLRHMGVGSFRTGFDDVRATLTSAPDGSLRLEGRARVESISIKNPPEFRAHVVEGADFFDATKHPDITFASERLQLNDDGTLELDGQLTIRGIARPLKATGTYEAPQEDPYGALRAAMELEATIDRRDWDMSWQAALPNGGDVLSWHVAIDVHLEFIKDAG